VKPQALHEAIEAAHKRQATPEFKAQYALRAGVESTISQGSRRFELRRSRYIGLAKTHLQQTINATAMNLVRIADWLKKGSVAQPKRRPGRFARLAPAALFGLAACEPSARPSYIELISFKTLVLSTAVATGSPCWLYFCRFIKPVCCAESPFFRSDRVAGAPRTPVRLLQLIVLLVALPYSQLHTENRVNF
jgi:transposase